MMPVLFIEGENMNADQIIKHLAELEYNQTLIAAALNRSPSLVSKVIHRRAKSMPVANLIAKILGMDLNQVFPEYQNKTSVRLQSRDFDRKVNFIRKKYLDKNHDQ